MLKSLQHKRFMKLNDKLSSTACYWYVRAERIIEPIGNVNDSSKQRPCYFYADM
jgi:hypothetical protein